MRLLNALRARLFGDGDEEPEIEAAVSPPERPPETPAFEDAIPGRQERAAGRILDDEGLRGDLTDDEYQPLLDWALTVTDQLAAATADLDDEQADAFLDGGLQTLRDALRAAQDAIVAQHEGRDDDRRAALDAVGAVVGTLGVQTAEFPLSALPETPDAEPDPAAAEPAQEAES